MNFPILQSVKRTAEAAEIAKLTIKKLRLKWKSSIKIVMIFYQLPENTAKGMKVAIATLMILINAYN